MNAQSARQIRARRRAVVAVQVGVVLVVLIGFAALTVDLGRKFRVRGELQRAADASALAGASAYTTDLMMAIRMGTGESNALYNVLQLVDQRANQYAQNNATLELPTYIDANGIITGWLNPNADNEAIHQNPQPFDYNAVRVDLFKSSAAGQSVNGPLDYLFAPIFGTQSGNTGVTATAIFDDRVSGYQFTGGGATMLPFTVHEDAYMQDWLNGDDQFGYDEDSNVVFESADGVREVRLYPYPLSGDPDTGGDGNFGVLNIGTGNQGLQALRDQITNGVSPEDMEMEISTSNPVFFDNGIPVTYDITGSPGLDGGLVDAIDAKVGDVVGFFLHNKVILSGSNAIYTITAIRFGRVMSIKLTGPPNQRGFFVQPVSYVGTGVQVDADAPSSNGQAGMLVLFR